MKNLAIIGLGNMGQALLEGLIDGNVLDRKDIYGIEKEKDKIKKVSDNLKIRCTDKYDVLRNADVILLAVKPQNMAEVLEKIKKFSEKKLIISIAAGIGTGFIKKYLKNSKIVRCMPNTPALVRKGVTGVFCDEGVSEEDKVFVTKVLKALGEVIFFEKEDDIDKLTALSGSGPAYVYYFLESLEEAGVLIGLSRSDARRLAKLTFEGSIELISKTSKTPGELREMVTSPGGTTISALHVFDKEGLKGIIMTAILNAYKRSKELGS